MCRTYRDNFKALFRQILPFLIFATLLRIPALFVPHLEGDEVTYQALAQEMNWDLSHYTTQDHPVVRTFPGGVYRLPLFFHPPLLPLFIKVGQVFGRGVEAGLFFEWIGAILLLCCAHQVSRQLNFSRQKTHLLLGLVATCPVLNFSTTHLHLDGLSAAFFFAAVVTLLEALKRDLHKLVYLSAVLAALALNLKFNILIAIPILSLPWIYFGLRCDPPAHGKKPYALLAQFTLIVALLGLPHYLRFYDLTGSLIPLHDIDRQETINYNAFTQMIFRRTRMEMVLRMLLIIPPLWVLFIPSKLRSMTEALKTTPILRVYVAGAAYLLLFTLAQDNLFRQERYYALLLPFLYPLLLLSQGNKELGKRELGYFILGITLMGLASYRNCVLFPQLAIASPSLPDFFPFLAFVNQS